MSARDKIISIIDIALKDICQEIAVETGASTADIYSKYFLAGGKGAPPVNSIGNNVVNEVGGTSVVPSYTEDELTKMSKPQLSELCKELGIKCSGSKKELVTRIIERPSGPALGSLQSFLKPAAEKVKKPPAPKKLKKFSVAAASSDVQSQYPKFVFKKGTTTVIGRKNTDGSVVELTQKDIQKCKENNLEYVLPEDLDEDVVDAVAVSDELLFDEEEERTKQGSDVVADEEEEVDDDIPDIEVDDELADDADVDEVFSE